MKILKVMDLIQLNLKDLKANCNRFIGDQDYWKVVYYWLIIRNYSSHKKLCISLGIINVQRSKELLVMVL